MIDKNNYYRQFLNLSCLLNQYANTDPIKTETLIPELLKKQEEWNMSKILRYSTYHNIGTFYYMRSKYQQAYEAYHKCYKIDPTKSVALIFMCACSRNMGKELPNEILDHKCADKNYRKVILDYYISLKKECDYITLEEMIIYRITMSLQDCLSYQPYWAMFEKELYRLCKRTKKYSRLHRYIKIMEKYHIK